MEMETSTVAIGRSKPDEKLSLSHRLLRLNSVIWLAGLTLSFVLTVPVALRYEKTTSLSVMDGKLALDFERFITREHPYRNASLNSWAAMDLKLFHSGKPGVIIGSGDWLFTREEFPLPSTRDKLLPANLERIRATVALLHSQGIETVILPIPAKAEIYSEQVPPALRSHILPVAAVTQYLSAHNVPWIPVKDELLQAKANGEKIFFRTETHWTPEGARVTALLVERWLKAQGLETWAPKQFRVAAGKPAVLDSDLESFIPVRPMFSDALPPAETYIPYRITSTELGNDENALFGDTGHPIALVGTSYSADERWNFGGWLRNVLHTDIDNISEKGKGPYMPMDRFMQQLKAGKTGARLVIWEMPVRSLAMDYSAQTAAKAR